MGFVVVGTSRETAAFAATALSKWWEKEGLWAYVGSKHWLLVADCGGANSVRSWLWKWALQQVADEWGIAITVAHYPPGASKWNPIEHRLFSAISGNWQGEPLRDYETVLKFIDTTKSERGLCCRALLDPSDYPKGEKLTEAQKKLIRIKRSKVLPQWNYTIMPSRKRPSCF